MNLTFQGRNIESIRRVHSKEGIILKLLERLGPIGNDLGQKYVVSSANGNGKKSTKVVSRYVAIPERPKVKELSTRHFKCPTLHSHKLIFVTKLQHTENFVVGASLNGEPGNLVWSNTEMSVQNEGSKKE